MNIIKEIAIFLAGLFLTILASYLDNSYDIVIIFLLVRIWTDIRWER